MHGRAGPGKEKGSVKPDPFAGRAQRNRADPFRRTGPAQKKPRAHRQELIDRNESLRPRLGQIRETPDRLSQLRCRMRKAIPEALPERDDFSERMEVRENRRELEQVMDAAIDAGTQEADARQPVQDASKQKHGQERQ